MNKQWEVYTVILLKKGDVITSNEIAEKCNTNTVYVRKIINQLRSIGIPICSTKKGYYYSEEKSEISKTIDFLESRIKTQLEAMEGLKKILKKRGGHNE